MGLHEKLDLNQVKLSEIDENDLSYVVSVTGFIFM